MDHETAAFSIIALVFGGVAIAAHVVVGSFVRRDVVRHRFQDLIAGATSLSSGGATANQRQNYLTPAKLGIDQPTQRKIREDLIRAGFFNPDGVVAYTIGRWALLALLPSIGALAIIVLDYPNANVLNIVAAIAVLFAIGFYLPRAFISRHQRLLQDKYRVTFPDFLDMLVVCVNAGLSLEAALSRVTQELGPEDRELRANLDLMAGEMRAGRSYVEALKDCAERLALPEAISFASLVQQSLELGTDVAVSLTTFADEMRDKRMSSAEEKAASLPPKLTLPLGLFIFPVVLIVVLAPVVLRLMRIGGA